MTGFVPATTFQRRLGFFVITGLLRFRFGHEPARSWRSEGQLEAEGGIDRARIFPFLIQWPFSHSGLLADRILSRISCDRGWPHRVLYALDVMATTM